MFEESIFFFFFIPHGLDYLVFEVGRNLSIFARILLDLLKLCSNIPINMKSSVYSMLVTIFTVNQYLAVYQFSLTSWRQAKLRKVLHELNEWQSFSSLRNLSPSLLTDQLLSSKL